MADVTVREATADDVPGIRRVARASWHAAHDDIVGKDAVDDFLAEHYDAETLREQAAGDEPAFFVAEDGGIVGIVTAFPTDEEGTFALGRIYVHPDRWGEGIGTRLLDRTEAAVRERGGDRLRLVVMAENDVGVSFYESRGFERRGDHRDERLDVDGHVYAKYLSR